VTTSWLKTSVKVDNGYTLGGILVFSKLRKGEFKYVFTCYLLQMWQTNLGWLRPAYWRGASRRGWSRSL